MATTFIYALGLFGHSYALPTTCVMSDPVETRPTVWGRIRKVLNFAIDQWFLIGIAVVILLANFFPNVGRPGGIVHAEYSVKYGLVAIIFFISGLSLPLPNLVKRVRDWKLHLVTHGTSFILFPTVIFAIVSCVRASDPNFERFNKWALVGMVVLGVLPTTVSSNVVMTGQAGGDQSAATIEVILGNTIGTFLSPALLSMFFSSKHWEFARPIASGKGGITEIYRQVIMQLGLTVFVPLFVGEVIQYFFAAPVKWFRLTFKLAKVGSLCLLGVIWSTFSGAFYTHAFEFLSPGTLVLVLLVNIAMYILFSLMLFALATMVPFPVTKQGVKTTEPLFDPATVIALMFCGAAKGIILGAPVVSILYGGLLPLDAATVSIPLVLYQGSQVVLGQLTVALLRNWKNRVDARSALAPESDSDTATVPTDEGREKQRNNDSKVHVGDEPSDVEAQSALHTKPVESSP